MAETKRQPRESISTRIDHDAHAVIEKVAEERRTQRRKSREFCSRMGRKSLGDMTRAGGCTDGEPD